MKATSSGCVIKFRKGWDWSLLWRTYPANSANNRKPEVVALGNCLLRIMCASSIPPSVAAAYNALNPSIGRIRLLMKRRSCSKILFRYFWLTISIGVGQPKPLSILAKNFVAAGCCDVLKA